MSNTKQEVTEKDFGKQELRDRITQLRRERDAHQMDESDYTDAVLQLLTDTVKAGVNKALDKAKSDMKPLDDYDDTDPYQQGYMWMQGQAISAIEQVRKQYSHDT